jgi:molecular chaperone GrpE (heat shock protein)
MSEQTSSPTPGLTAYAAFLISDLVLLVVAWVVYAQAHRPMEAVELGVVAACTAVGAWLGVWPFVLRHRAELAREERADLADAVAQIQRIHAVAERVELATSQWQTAQEHAARAVEAARGIGDRITAETQGFKVFLEQAQNVERQHLQLEVNKLRRSEGEWLQTLVRILDHVYSLYAAAQRSGQPRLAEQITVFQNACRDVARRVGLVVHLASPGTAFDAAVHQLLDASAPVPASAVVTETIGPGYTFQGQLLRRMVVQVVGGGERLSSSGPVSMERAEPSLTGGMESAPELGGAVGPAGGANFAVSGPDPEAEVSTGEPDAPGASPS